MREATTFSRILEMKLRFEIGHIFVLGIIYDVKLIRCCPEYDVKLIWRQRRMI